MPSVATRDTLGGRPMTLRTINQPQITLEETNAAHGIAHHAEVIGAQG